MKFIGYWEVWHFALSMILFMGLYRFLEHKQLCFIIVIGVALLWEVGEWIYEKIIGYKSYGNVYNFKENALKDLGVALIGSLICIILL